MNKIIAIDGPAGSGKGTLAAAIAEKCNLLNIDTGATYRCLALAMLRNNLSLEDKEKIIDLSSKIDIKLTTDGKVYLNAEDVTDLIRSKEVTNIVSQISNTPEVRSNLINIQRKMAKKNDVVIEGRDITTVVFPNADYKIYLDASLEERVKRRFKEYQEKGIEMSYEEIYENIKTRDYNDMNKPVGALKRTDDQIYIDTTNMSIEEVINKVLEIIKG
ncbi:MAG: (d)CMP kinase [Bacilli bacterium]